MNIWFSEHLESVMKNINHQFNTHMTGYTMWIIGLLVSGLLDGIDKAAKPCDCCKNK